MPLVTLVLSGELTEPRWSILRRALNQKDQLWLGCEVVNVRTQKEEWLYLGYGVKGFN